MPKVLIVEDDQLLAGEIASCIQANGFEFELAQDGASALQLLTLFSFDLAIIDWDLGESSGSGLEVCRGYRNSGGRTGLLMLTGKTAIEHKVEGFSAGADDYLTKPFDTRELLSRMHALLRRTGQIAGDKLQLGALAVDTRACVVTANGQRLQLRPREYQLLEFFMRNPGACFKTEALLERIWPTHAYVSTETVRVCIHRLRSKLPAGANLPAIASDPGIGYKLALEE